MCHPLLIEKRGITCRDQTHTCTFQIIHIFFPYSIFFSPSLPYFAFFLQFDQKFETENNPDRKQAHTHTQSRSFRCVFGTDYHTHTHTCTFLGPDSVPPNEYLFLPFSSSQFIFFPLSQFTPLLNHLYVCISLREKETKRRENRQ